MRALAIREGLNLKRCTAYSDSYNDVPMLSLVGTAVAINPDADLRVLARERGWEIRDFRTARKAARIGCRRRWRWGGRRSPRGGRVRRPSLVATASALFPRAFSENRVGRQPDG